ncbi:hypothetical protein AV530_004331 [Patagioenas fasciata monilis]|uniref:Uncharacterized protein n=1 Tax=Patagioenas fasciata monilis TaxID=372326 RepID=A0A1V4K920_PATFA|nr:hypothetical protein AV530_004331 [Patagioenas fasciata monilis]
MKIGKDVYLKEICCLLVLLPAAKTQGKSESATTPLLLPSQQHPARLGVVEPRMDPLPLDVGASPAQLLPQPPMRALSKKTAAAAITFQQHVKSTQDGDMEFLGSHQGFAE